MNHFHAMNWVTVWGYRISYYGAVYSTGADMNPSSERRIGQPAATASTLERWHDNRYGGGCNRPAMSGPERAMQKLAAMAGGDGASDPAGAPLQPL